MYQFCCPFELCRLEKQHRSSRPHSAAPPHIHFYYYFIVLYVFRHSLVFREYICIVLGMIKVFCFYFFLKVL